MRELSRTVSKILEMVESGEDVVVTRHGRAIAKIVPVEEETRDQAFERLVREGVVTPAERPGKMPLPEFTVPLAREVVDDLLRER